MNVSPHATWEHLLVKLDETQAVFHQFLNLLSTEERHLQVLNRQGLNEVNSQKEYVLDAMFQIEQQVERELQQLLGKVSHETLGSILKKHPNPHAQSASAKLNTLGHLAETIQEQGKKNEAIVSRIQEKIREAIAFMYTGLGSGPVYQGSGSLTVPSVLSSVHLQG